MRYNKLLLPLLPLPSNHKHNCLLFAALQSPTSVAAQGDYTSLHSSQSTVALERYVEYIVKLPPIDALPSPGLVRKHIQKSANMPSSRGQQTVKPVIVEVKPSNVGGSNIAPSSPPASPNTKKARFASTLVEGYTRPLTTTEAWSLYNFELHARQCRLCNEPLRVIQRGDALCESGHALMLDVAEHVYYHAGEVYSRTKDDHKPVRVEIQPGYYQLRSLLQAMDRTSRSARRTVPIVSYDQTYAETPRRRSSPKRREQRREGRRERERREEDNEYEKVTIEPASSTSRRRTSHKSKLYSTVVVDNDVEATSSRQPERKSESRKGSLYDAEIERQKKDKGYVVEIREPSSKGREREREQRRKEEKRRSGYYC